MRYLTLQTNEQPFENELSVFTSYRRTLVNLLSIKSLGINNMLHSNNFVYKNVIHFCIAIDVKFNVKFPNAKDLTLHNPIYILKL